MISEPTGTALLYSGGMLTDLHGKTSHGLLRYSKRFQIFFMTLQRLIILVDHS